MSTHVYLVDGENSFRTAKVVKAVWLRIGIVLALAALVISPIAFSAGRRGAGSLGCEPIKCCGLECWLIVQGLGEEAWTARYDLNEMEWRLIEPLLPNIPRGVARVDDRQVINGIFYVLRTGSQWRDLPSRYGPYTTAYGRFNRWTRAGVWLKVFEALAARSPASIHFIDGPIMPTRQHGAGGKRGWRVTPSAVFVED